MKAGYDLPTAYEYAVKINPVSAAKEVARIQTEAEANLNKKNSKEVIEAKNATKTNIKSRDTKTAHTEPLGTMEDTAKKTLRKINARTH